MIETFKHHQNIFPCKKIEYPYNPLSNIHNNLHPQNQNKSLKKVLFTNKMAIARMNSAKNIIVNLNMVLAAALLTKLSGVYAQPILPAEFIVLLHNNVPEDKVTLQKPVKSGLAKEVFTCAKCRSPYWNVPRTMKKNHPDSYLSEKEKYLKENGLGEEE